MSLLASDISGKRPLSGNDESESEIGMLAYKTVSQAWPSFSSSSNNNNSNNSNSRRNNNPHHKS
jgi:hypothetical protein